MELKLTRVMKGNELLYSNKTENEANMGHHSQQHSGFNGKGYRDQGNHVFFASDFIDRAHRPPSSLKQNVGQQS